MREEENRKLAKWLGWRFIEACGQWFPPDYVVGTYNRGYLPDFYTSEEANAMLLEKMAETGVCVQCCKMGESSSWYCYFGFGDNDGEDYRVDTDRKTVICAAALALIEASSL